MVVSFLSGASYFVTWLEHLPRGESTFPGSSSELLVSHCMGNALVPAHSRPPLTAMCTLRASACAHTASTPYSRRHRKVLLGDRATSCFSEKQGTEPSYQLQWKPAMETAHWHWSESWFMFVWVATRNGNAKLFSENDSYVLAFQKGLAQRAIQFFLLRTFTE